MIPMVVFSTKRGRLCSRVLQIFRKLLRQHLWLLRATSRLCIKYCQSKLQSRSREIAVLQIRRNCCRANEEKLLSCKSGEIAVL